MPDKAPPKKPKRFKPMLDMLNTEAAVGTLAPKTYALPAYTMNMILVHL